MATIEETLQHAIRCANERGLRAPSINFAAIDRLAEEPPIWIVDARPKVDPAKPALDDMIYRVGDDMGFASQRPGRHSFGRTLGLALMSFIDNCAKSDEELAGQ